MEESMNLALLRLLHRCAHRMHMAEKYRGQGWLMILLKNQGTLTQRELGEITGRRSATLSEQLEGMDIAGYVTRGKNETDKRNVDVTLTPLGLQKALEVEANRTEVAERLFSVLSEAEKQTLCSLLQRLADQWAALPTEKEE
jgi:MarR family transcriptional regulator, lower aerobic nicotinate degradation pathway regulator